MVENLIHKYLEGGLREEVMKDFASLMKHEGVEYVGYRVYTPSFNDGDVCEYTVWFLDKIDHITPCEDFFLSLDKDTNELIVTYVEDLENLEDCRVSSYKTEWGKLVEKMAPLMLETNTEGVIKLDGDTITLLGTQGYYYDY